jgi:hypothetical protein
VQSSTVPSAEVVSLRRGFRAGLWAVLVLLVASFPSRLSGALHSWGDPLTKASKVLAGTVLDLSGVLFLIAPLLLVGTLVVPLVLRRLRGPRWQQLGASLVALPFGFGLYVLTVVVQEVKGERGSYPTMFDLAEGGTNASFIGGTLGFVRYARIWVPAVVGVLLTVGLLGLLLRRLSREPAAWRGWTLGLVAGLGLGTLAVNVTAVLQGSVNRLSAAALGDPLTGLVESSFDLLRHQGPATPRDLVISAEFPVQNKRLGPSLLGWPPATGHCEPHPYARPLDTAKEPPIRDERGRALIKALEQLSAALFVKDAPPIAVFQLSLEGFRADDVHALNPEAAAQVSPFTSGLYEHPVPGVLTSKKLFQAGVRTAHCLGAMTCGVGTLPYNLSFIRDLEPFPMRCASDVLKDAGFAQSFFYGSDGTFDGMADFFRAHGYGQIVTQLELPEDLPKGTWDGITDFAIFDEAATRVAAALEKDQTPQFAFLMSLSNHSPFTTPQDLPEEIRGRVDEALKTVVNRADSDDRLRLLTHSYTDAAVARLFEKLEALQLSERSIVLLMADHSTGHAYVWGPQDPESDAAKSQIPFAIVIPPAFVARAKDPKGLARALSQVQTLLDAAPLSQNDVPRLLLALLSAHPLVQALPQASRWHSLGGQVTSPYFSAGGDPASYILGVNGISELYALNRAGQRVGGYEDSVFLKTRVDRYRVTPRLIPVSSTLIEVLQCATPPAAALTT